MNLAKLDDVLDESPTVMVGGATKNNNLVKIGANQNPVVLSSRPTVAGTEKLTNTRQCHNAPHSYLARLVNNNNCRIEKSKSLAVVYANVVTCGQ